MRKHRQPTSARISTILYVATSIGPYDTQNQRSLKNKQGTSTTLALTFNFLHTSGGLWAVAREIQTNDMSIRIRFHFLVSAPRKFVSFGFCGGCAEAERIRNDSPEGPKSFCQVESMSRGIFLDHLLHKCHSSIVQWLNYPFKKWFNVKLLWGVPRVCYTNVTNS